MLNGQAKHFSQPSSPQDNMSGQADGRAHTAEMPWRRIRLAPSIFLGLR